MASNITGRITRVEKQGKKESGLNRNAFLFLYKGGERLECG
jgi:hypothetical protein